MKTTTTKKIVLSALFAAICCLGTMIIRIPTPTGGYVHIGDGCVLLSGVVLGPWYGFLAAGIGSMLADLFSGYVIYIPGTFIIKAVCALIVGLFYRGADSIPFINKRFNESEVAQCISLGLFGLIAEAVMVIGYFFYKILLLLLVQDTTLSFSAAAISAASGIPSNIAQGVVGAIICMLLTPTLKRFMIIK